MIRLINHLGLRRGTAAGLLLTFLAFAGCTPVLKPAPGPAAEAAAASLASEFVARRSSPATGDPDSDDFQHFARVYDRIRNFYVREIDDHALLEAATARIRETYPEAVEANEGELVSAAIDGMLASLDPYSIYLRKEDFTAIREQTRGSFSGIGLRVAKGERHIKVISPIDGTPAAVAGLQPGDRITHADGAWIGDLSLRDAVAKLRGPEGSHVRLLVERDGTEPFEVTVTRQVIRVNPVRYETREPFGYVRVSTFTAQATAQLLGAVLAMREQVSGGLKGLLIDLRNNPGGLLDESVTVSDAFLDEGVIVTTRGRTHERHFRARPGDILAGLPMVVLVNEGSASAAEIVAGALADNGRALMIGTKTFGKGTVQTIMPIGRNDALKLTTAQYFTPSGRSVEGGLMPQVVVLQDEAKEGDEQLERGYAELVRMAGAGAAPALPVAVAK